LSLFQKGYSDFKEKVDAIEITPLSTYLKATQLHYLSVFMQYRDDPIIENQIAVITEITQKENKNTVYLYNTEEEIIEFSNIVNDIGNMIDSQINSTDSSNVEIEIPPQLAYSTELLNVMAVATRGKNAITEVMCQSLLPGPEFVKLYREAKFLYNYKTALVEYFIDAYLDIEKDVPPSLQEDIWEFVEMLNAEFELFMTRLTDIAVYSYHKNPNDLNGGQRNGPKIILKGLFGKQSIRDLQEDYVLKTLLNCIENIFQLRMVIKDSRDETIVRSIIEKLARMRAFTSKKEYKQKIGHIMEIIKKNPQLRQIRDDLMEQNSELNMDVGIPSLGKSKSKSRSQVNSGKKFDALGSKAGVHFADPLTQSQGGKGSFFHQGNSVALKMAFHLNELKLMQAFDEAAEKEFEDLARSIIGLKEKSEAGFGGA